MDFNDMSDDQLRAHKAKKYKAFRKAQDVHRDEMLEIQAVMDVRQKTRTTNMYAASIGPEAVSAIVEAAVAAADSGTPMPGVEA